MASSFSDIETGRRLAGVVADGEVTVVAITYHGDTSATLTYRTGAGTLDERILTVDDLAGISQVSDRRWTFDADGAAFRLASEARRMKWAHLSDPFAAVDTSNIEPYPHQIDAVYNRFLNQKPLRFLLADDPGAGKTIMSGLLIRELMLRGDVARCLIVAPGSLVEQWQDELWEKFGVEFELMSRHAVEASRSGNPFLDKNLLVARVDQLSRAEDLQAKLAVTDWDLVIVDEAHKMSAHQYGNELRKTKRFVLGELLRERTRHLLLLSATPHNGKNEDFLAFMTLIDPERFTGRLRANDEMPDVSDVMRRLVKENLRTFEGKHIFPKRYAYSLNFELSPLENELYEAVTEYVRNGMNRAARMQEEGDKRKGIIVAFALAGLQRRLASSPAAIYHSLRRRKERLAAQAEQLRDLAAGGGTIPATQLPKGVKFADLEDFDYDDYDDEELEALEDYVIDAATAAATADELEAEVIELGGLVELADEVRQSGEDTKWNELRDLLRSDEFKTGDGPRKLIVFSEHKDTLTYVSERVAAELGRPEAVVTIHGGVKRHDRKAIQDRFRVDPTVQVLVATDAAGEGVNLQVANMMVNYDLPWNPNRIEQRFGRIHRIGQDRPCHLWNLVAHQTREGKVFERLFQKIEQQKAVYHDQVYDVLGDSQINRSLQDLLIKAIRDDDDPTHAAYMDEIIEGEIGGQLQHVLQERALVGGLGEEANTDKIRDLMERSRARKLQPWFVEAFFTAALKEHGGRITGREAGRFEITRVPAAIRGHADPTLGPVHDRYSRVTFDKANIAIDRAEWAELISPGTPLLTAVVEKVLADHGATLAQGATLVAPDDPSTEPRLLVYLDHTVTDGRHVEGRRQVVSRRFQYVEIDRHGHVVDPGTEPYIGYAPIADEQRAQLDDGIDLGWADRVAEDAAKSWAIEHLAGPHFEEMSAVTSQRIAKVRGAVRERLEAEIRYWDQRAEELKTQELQGKKPRISSGRARTRADELEARMARRRLELDLQADLHNNPPTIVGAALVIPQGLLDSLAGHAPAPEAVADKMETDRRGVEAVCKVERALGRNPTPQHHSNPGFDIDSVDPATGIHYFIEVKSHLPQTTEISVSAQQVQKAKSNPERWRLAIASVPTEPNEEPIVKYLVAPFRDVTLHFAQTKVPMTVAKLLAEAGAPLLTDYKPKLIEVALPLATINAEAAREKSIRHGHPSTLHLWWARRPLAVARAVIWASLVDDPSGDESLSAEQQESERQRLFRILERLVKWENSNDADVLAEATAEIDRCFPNGPPPILDPFGGGGAIPLEAQRLGLKALSGDLNPVAVLIQKAMIEIPPRFAGRPPVHPDIKKEMTTWERAQGLAADVEAYGQWMRDEAEMRIGYRYPKATGPSGEKLTPIAWIWARTVESPDPTWKGHVPLVASWELSKRKGQAHVWVEPQLDRAAAQIHYSVRVGGEPTHERTVVRGNGRCIATGSAIPGDYIKAEGRAGRLGQQLLAVVADDEGGRVYCTATGSDEAAALEASAPWLPEGRNPEKLTGGTVFVYGLDEWSKLFTPRQQLALATFTDLLAEVRERVLADATASDAFGASEARLRDGGGGAAAYADAVVTYLAFVIDKCANLWSSLVSWMNDRGAFREVFARQAIPMTWDFAEANPFSGRGGGWDTCLDKVQMAVAALPAAGDAEVRQRDARARVAETPVAVLSTDPPYYDNISYADLSDFFFVWMRRGLGSVWPDECATLLTPKAEELIANQHRAGSRKKAEAHFESGMAEFMAQVSDVQVPDVPCTIYYAYKATESDEGAVRSTGWDTFLQAVLDAGLRVTATWPVRTESPGRILARGTNALASSIVLACRQRTTAAPLASRGEFIAALRSELPEAVRILQSGNIAPVDLAQSTIGPGIKVFSRYAKVVEADGSSMSVSDALAIINDVLGEVLDGEEAELDRDSRFAVTWYTQNGYNPGRSGDADAQARAKNTSLSGIEDAGIGEARGGQFRLFERSELDPDWSPVDDDRRTVWEATQHLVAALERSETEAAELLHRMGGYADRARQLAYVLFQRATDKSWAEEAGAYNGLITAWPSLQAIGGSGDAQGSLL